MYSTNEKPGSGKFFIESAAWDFQSSNFWVEFLCSGIFFEGRVQQRPSPFFTRSAPRHERVRGAKETSEKPPHSWILENTLDLFFES